MRGTSPNKPEELRLESSYTRKASAEGSHPLVLVLVLVLEN